MRDSRHRGLPGKCMERRKGISLLWTAIFLLLFILFIGLALDTAKVYLVSHQLQNAADAAALAGASFLKSDPNSARQRAIDIAYLNFADANHVQLRRNEGNTASGDIVFGQYDKENFLFTVDMNQPNAVKVVARRTTDSLGGPVSLVFGPVADVYTAEVARYAIAIASGGTGAGLICLDPTGQPGLRFSGGINVDVNDGAIQVNSEVDGPVVVNGSSGSISAEELNIVSTSPVQGSLPSDLPVNYDQPPIPDPLCNGTYCMEPPTWNPADDLTTSLGVEAGQPITSASSPLEPGYYSGGFRFTSGSVSLNPGVYILDGSGLYINGGTFVADGVMFYIIGDGAVNIGGNAAVHITPIESGYYEGMSIFQARDNDNDSVIIGGSGSHIEGTLYFPAAELELGGTESWTAGNQLIANTMWIHGNGTITINYDGRNPSPGNRSYLVE